MRVISQYQTRPPSNCCFGLVFSSPEPKPKDVRKELKKKLNLIMLSNQHPFGISQKFD